MNRAGDRVWGIEAGAIAGIVGFVAFLVLHHLWIAPIWFIAPVGAGIAAILAPAIVVAEVRG